MKKTLLSLALLLSSAISFADISVKTESQDRDGDVYAVIFKAANADRQTYKIDRDQDSYYVVKMHLRDSDEVGCLLEIQIVLFGSEGVSEVIAEQELLVRWDEAAQISFEDTDGRTRSLLVLARQHEHDLRKEITEFLRQRVLEHDVIEVAE